jgi:hypothetical protein
MILLKIDLKNVKLRPGMQYDHLRQQLVVNIDTALSGSRTGQWAGSRVKKNQIYLFFRASDPPKAKEKIDHLLKTCELLSPAKIRTKEKTMKWRNYTFM